MINEETLEDSETMHTSRMKGSSLTVDDAMKLLNRETPSVADARLSFSGSYLSTRPSFAMTS